MPREIEVGGQPVTIGRNRSNSIVIDQLGVSRRHAVLRRTPMGLELRDLKSSNGSFVNGKKVERAEITAGDVIQIGGRQLLVTHGGVLLPDAAADLDASLARPGIQVWLWGVLLVVAALLLAALLRVRPTPSPAGPMTAEPGTGLMAGATDTAAPDATETAAQKLRPTTTPQPTKSALTLLSPLPGDSAQGMVNFSWRNSRPLTVGEVYDVRICTGDGCQPTEGKTNTRQTDWQWCPDAGEGRYRWQVVVVDQFINPQNGAAGPVAEFLWTGGCGGGKVRADDHIPQDGPTSESPVGDTPVAPPAEPSTPSGPGKGPVTPILP